MGQEVEGLSQEDRGLVQVEDADVEPRAVNEWSHLFRQRPRCVTQMNSGLKQICDTENDNNHIEDITQLRNIKLTIL